MHVEHPNVTIWIVVVEIPIQICTLIQIKKQIINSL